MDEKKKSKKQQEAQTIENEKPNEQVDVKAKEVENEVEQLKKQVEEYKDKWMRNVAEFDNYKKRNAKLWSEAYFDGVKDAVLKIIPIGDNLERALSMGLEPKTQEGIKNLQRQFIDSLKTLGVEEINPVGEKFDFSVAEAVMQVDGDETEQSETVKQVFEKGYKYKDKVIKYAKVSVTK